MRHATHLLGVLQILTHHVHCKAGRRVVHGPVLSGNLPAAVRGAYLELMLSGGKLWADEADGDASWAQVLLEASVNVRMLAHLDRLGAEVGGHVSDKWDVPNIRGIAELNAVDCLIRAVVNVSSLWVQLPSGLVGDAGEFRRLCVARDLAGAVLGRLLVRLLTPLPSDKVVSLCLCPDHVQRHRGELESGATLRQDDLIVIRHAEDVAQVLLGLSSYLHELLRAVRHLHHTHAAALVIDHFPLDLLQDLKRHHARAGREVVHAS
mmetsp:Transcript_13879/g.16009  ORF Transcript_13879/g.16009 Transcript_13879/m.16009 type:complete len:264 (-) Transcript_13879:124-915(-)